MHERPVVDLTELIGQSAAMLPRRDTLCYIGCVNVTNIVGVNLAIAVNAATSHGSVTAVAGQYLAALH